MTAFSRWGLTPFGPVPNERRMEWYRRGRTAFLHFTVNTFTDREFTDACREFGLKVSLYLSPWDRNHPAWGQDAYNDVYAAQLTGRVKPSSVRVFQK